MRLCRATLKIRVIVSAILVAAVVLVLVAPWYPVVRNWQVTQTYTDPYTYSYQVTSADYQSNTVYALPSPVTLQGYLQSGATFDQVFKSEGDITLQSGSMVTVDVSQCTSCVTSLDEDFGSKSTVFSVAGPTSGDFTVTDSGSYKISIFNAGTTADQVTSITIIANVPQVSTPTIVLSDNVSNTVTVTQYSVTTLQPFNVLGTLPSLIVVVVMVLLLAFFVLIDFGLIQISTRRRRRK